MEKQCYSTDCKRVTLENSILKMNQGQVNCSDAFFNNTNDNIEAINY